MTQCVRFSGYVADPVEAMRQLDIVVSFSDVVESFGRTIVEAMAARRPVIAWDRGGISEIIRHGKDGFLVPYLDTTAALERLEELADNADLVREMGRNGRERAKELFSREAMAPQLKEIYRRIVAAWEERRAEAKADNLLETLRSCNARSAAYFHPFEISSAFRIPPGIICSNYIDERTGTVHISLANGKPNAASTGQTEGYSIRLPDTIEAAASGHRVSVSVVARAAGAAQSRFALAYSTNDVGNSGWRWQGAGPEWSVFTMEYTVPAMKNGNGDFVGILPDMEGQTGTEFCYLWINTTERRPTAEDATIATNDT